MESKKAFISVTTLRSELSESGDKLKLIHPHKIWVASFAWANPTALSEVKEIERELNLKIPEDYVTFLTTISNGATLFYDIKYGQWGYKIYGTEQIVSEQKKWEQTFKAFWSATYLAVGEIIEESHVLVMDLNKPTKDGTSCVLIDGSVYDPPLYWPKVSQSFHEWLDNLITAQGAKYWLWK